MLGPEGQSHRRIVSLLDTPILDLEAYRFLHFAENQLKDEPEFLDRAADVARDVLEMPSRLDSCTQQNEGGARCWMVTEAEELNKFLKPFGVEFNELREGSLDLIMTHNDPVAPYDLKAVLLCLATLWFLHERRCFSGVSLNVLGLDRFRPGQFLQHITVAKWVVPVHLIGFEELRFRMFSMLRVLDQTELLTHLTLDRAVLPSCGNRSICGGLAVTIGRGKQGPDE
ncbi:uncharacterized protein LOC125941569 [Dermacentor silvarum]|uniref:uncharacterized protein LOC125941569 n=1 Tax=Dermacentor silvarum TaxID=543639 RepID=UPI0021007B58|nr:uncharacterized protein LOC125941569 [Dermacentor silvarum]